jgi:purine-binding chemotaxis protein CheW
MTEEPKTDLRELISFRIGEQRYCVDIMDVREIRGWAPATPLPHAPEYMCGVINLRGTILPIVDLAARFRLGASKPTSRHVVIVVAVEGKLAGLLVDAVCDILNVAEGEVQATPDMLGEETHEFVEGLLTVEDTMVGLIRLASVMPPAERLAA